MVNLFGDWWADAAVMFLVFIVFVYFWIFYLKDKRSRNRAGLWVAIIIFAISGFEVLGKLFGDTFSGPQEGFIISLIVMVLALFGILIGLEEEFSEKK